MGILEEICESAKLDGVSDMQILLFIFLNKNFEAGFVYTGK